MAAKLTNNGPERRKVNSKALVPTEEQESLSLAAWARLMVETGQEPRLRLMRCGFEGLRLPMGLRCKVKRQSISTGWPDWHLSVLKMGRIYPDERWHIVFAGLYIELKRRKGGTVSQEQRDMHVLLMQQGYEVCVCKGADEAIATIKAYLGLT